MYADFWTVPDYDEMHLFNETAEQATIKSILNGTASARAWSDIQSTWGYISKPKPRVIRVIKVKHKVIHVKPIKQVAMTKDGRKLYRILLANGSSREEAKRTANELTRN